MLCISSIHFVTQGKISGEKALVLLIAPLWATKSWYTLLLQLLVDNLILLPRKGNLLFQPHSQTLHSMKDHLVLAAWRLSGNPLETEAFLMKQPVSLRHRGRMEWCSWCTQRKVDTLQPPVNEAYFLLTFF